MPKAKAFAPPTDPDPSDVDLILVEKSRLQGVTPTFLLRKAVDDALEPHDLKPDIQFVLSFHEINQALDGQPTRLFSRQMYSVSRLLDEHSVPITAASQTEQTLRTFIARFSSQPENR